MNFVDDLEGNSLSAAGATTVSSQSRKTVRKKLANCMIG